MMYIYNYSTCGYYVENQAKGHIFNIFIIFRTWDDTNYINLLLAENMTFKINTVAIDDAIISRKGIHLILEGYSVSQ